MVLGASERALLVSVSMAHDAATWVPSRQSSRNISKGIQSAEVLGPKQSPADDVSDAEAITARESWCGLGLHSRPKLLGVYNDDDLSRISGDIVEFLNADEFVPSSLRRCIKPPQCDGLKHKGEAINQNALKQISPSTKGT